MTNRLIATKTHVLNQLCGFLREREMLPAIAFVFSRKQVELYASSITVPVLEFDSKVAYTVKYECEQIIRKLPNYLEYLQLPEYIKLVELLEKGIGIHHSGMIPILREIVELMISKKYIKILFATESFAIGLDCPIKTAIFTSLTKFDGHNERYLMSHEYTQMAGRAGRRGIDTIGHVVHCNNLFKPLSSLDYKTILNGIPQKLVSKFRISYSLMLNLLKNGQTTDFHLFIEKSMVHNEIQNAIKGLIHEKTELTEEISKKMKFIEVAETPRTICDELLSLNEIIPNCVNKRRKKAEKDKQLLVYNYKNIINDAARVNELNNLKIKCQEIDNVTKNTISYIKSQTDTICDILLNSNIIKPLDDTTQSNSFELTTTGKFASNISELHPLIISRLVNEKWNNFADFSTKQMIGLFSCFTTIKVSDEYKLTIENIDDSYLCYRIKEIENMCIEYNDIEYNNSLDTGIDYDNMIQYDIVELSMKWCDCSNEMECKQFIQTDVSDMSISVGDFTKSMLKIVTIANEFINIYEQSENTDTLYKLSLIERMILKYIMTSQSLYV